MLNHQTIDLLNSLKLSGMANALETQLNNAEMQSLSFEERLALLVESEQNERLNRRQRRLIRDAKLKISSACLENISYSSNRRLDRSQINELGVCRTFNSEQQKREIIAPRYYSCIESHKFHESFYHRQPKH